MTQIIAGTVLDLQKTPAQYIKELLETNWSSTIPAKDNGTNGGVQFYNSWTNEAGSKWQFCVLQRVEVPTTESMGRQRSDIDSSVDVHIWGRNIVVRQENQTIIPELLNMRNEFYRIIREHWQDITIFWDCRVSSMRRIEDEPLTQYSEKSNWHYVASINVKYSIVTT